MPRVLIAAATLRTETAFRDILRRAGFEVVFPEIARQLTEDEILTELRGIDAVLAGSEPYTPRVLDAHPQLKVIARNGVGYDAVDVAAATARGIPVTVAPANLGAVAEHTFALLLALAKQILPQDRAVRQGGWPRQATQPLRGRTLGLAGLGRIGKAVAVRAAAFEMKLLAYEPYPDQAFVQQYGVSLVSMEQLFAESDYVSLHLPLSAESRALIDRRYLGRMKPTAYFINTSRGGVVNEADLLEVLRDKKIAGAGLDVFADEPPGDSPLLKLDNVVLTAHTAGVDARSGTEMSTLAAETIVRLSRGEWPAALVVNPEVKDKFQWKKN